MDICCTASTNINIESYIHPPCPVFQSGGGLLIRVLMCTIFIPHLQGQKRTTNGRTRVSTPSQKRKPQKLSGASIPLPFARAISWKNTTNIIRPAINQAPFLLEGVVVNNQHSDEQFCYQYIALWLHRVTSSR